MDSSLNRPLKNISEAADTQQKQVKECNSCVTNAHFEPVFNIIAAMQIVFQRSAKHPVTFWSFMT
ncbi:hypothetical protein C8R34_11335 [Nitrosomonas sp. Nm84]|nr:hypothetical protein C8R34_11335 [Nitrosomonas sp. Nm84]